MELDAILSGTAALVLLLAASIPFASASGVSLGVDETLQAELLLTDARIDPGAPKQFTLETKNQGSASFTGRMRLDVLDEDNRTVFRAWSDPIDVAPGALAARQLAYYAPERNGTMTAVATLHYGTERQSLRTTFDTTPQQVPDGFDVRDVTASRDSVRLHLAVPEDVDTFFVTVNDRSTRRFAQRKIGATSRRATVIIPYHPPLPADRTEPATVTVSAQNGKYYYTGDVSLTRRTGLGARIDRWVTTVLSHMPIM